MDCATEYGEPCELMAHARGICHDSEDSHAMRSASIEAIQQSMGVIYVGDEVSETYVIQE